MSFVSPAVDHVAKKIARVPGVSASYIGKDGAVDAVLETAFDRVTRQEVIQIGMRAMVPVRVFYQMPDGETIGEAEAKKYESLEDYYTKVHVAGFATDTPTNPPEDLAGDSYSRVKIGGDAEKRDASGQLKLVRIRAKTRGRPVVGWKYGSKSVKKGDRVKFKKACCLQWTMGRTMQIPAGTTGMVMQMSSRRPIAYLNIGDNEKVELPIHAVGHVYDVMVDPSLESRNRPSASLQERKSVFTPTMKRLMNTVGFGRLPGQDDTPSNSANFVGPDQPDLIGYGGSPEEDMLAPPKNKSSIAADEPKVKVRKNGKVQKKTVLLGRNK